MVQPFVRWHFSTAHIWSWKQISCIIYVKYLIAWVTIVVYAVCKCLNICQIDVDLVNSVIRTAHIHSTFLIDNTLWIDNTHTIEKIYDLLAFNKILTLSLTVVYSHKCATIYTHFNTIINLHFSYCRLGTYFECDFLVLPKNGGFLIFTRNFWYRLVLILVWGV